MTMTVEELVVLLLKEDAKKEVRVVMELEPTHGSIVYSNDIVLSNRMGFLAVTGRNGR